MTTFEAIGLLDSEQVNQISMAKETLSIDRPDGEQLMNNHQFYATFDGKFSQSIPFPFSNGW